MHTILRGKTGHRFIVQEYKVDGSSWRVDALPGLVDAFDVAESETDDRVIFVWSRLGKLFYMEVDFNTQEVTAGPTEKHDGLIPSIAEIEGNRILYLRDRALYTRLGIDGSEDLITDPSKFLVLHQDTYRKYDTRASRFVGLQTPGYKVALPLVTDVNTILRYDYHTTEITGVDYLEDQSGNDYHAELDTLEVRDAGLYFPVDDELSIPSWSVSSSITIEAWVIPQASRYRADILGGQIELSYNNTGRRLQFSFEGVSTHTYRQGLTEAKVYMNEPVYVGVIHTFGDGSLTKLLINGKEVDATWVEGDGDEDPGFTTIPSTIALGKGSYLNELRISSGVKTEAEILEYINGRIE